MYTKDIIFQYTKEISREINLQFIFVSLAFKTKEM